MRSRGTAGKQGLPVPSAASPLRRPLTFDVRPFMKSLGWLCALLANGFIAFGFGSFGLEPGVPFAVRAMGAAVSVLFLCVVFFLVLARINKLPRYGTKLMAGLCVAIPVLWVASSLDYGILSGQEIVSGALISLLSLGSWHAFKLFPPSA